jgi:DNA-binding HxlR family transcriptional regulator
MVFDLSDLDRLVAFLERGKNRTIILKKIAEASGKALGSSELAEETDITQSAVIRTLNGLEREGVISEVAQVKRGRRYRITDMGSEALEIIEKAGS